jgi:hypothetical protein
VQDLVAGEEHAPHTASSEHIGDEEALLEQRADDKVASDFFIPGLVCRGDYPIAGDHAPD